MVNSENSDLLSGSRREASQTVDSVLTGIQRSKINRSLVPALAQQDLSQDEGHGVLFSLQCVSVSMDVC